MKVGVMGASGYAGVELLRLCAGHPEFEVVVATAGTHAGETVARHTPSLAAAYPSLDLRRHRPGRARRGRRRLLRLAARRVPVDRRRPRRPGRHRRRSRRRLPPARSLSLPGLVRSRAHRSPTARNLRDRASRTAPRGAGPRPPHRGPRLLPDRGDPRARPARRRRAGRGRPGRAPLVVDAASGTSGAGRAPGPLCTSPPWTRTSPPTGCSITATHPRWSRRSGRRSSSRPTSPRWSGASSPPVTGGRRPAVPRTRRLQICSRSWRTGMRRSHS